MTTKCSQCSQSYEVDAALNGQTAQCSACGADFTISPVLIPSPRKPAQPQNNVAQNNDALTRALIPIGRSVWALAAGYLGLLSVLVVFAPFAILAGVMALHDIGKHPEKCGKGRAWFGIIMGISVILFALGAVLFS